MGGPEFQSRLSSLLMVWIKKKGKKRKKKERKNNLNMPIYGCSILKPSSMPKNPLYMLPVAVYNLSMLFWYVWNDFILSIRT